MKKYLVIALIILLNINTCFAISDEDKAEIESIIDNNYKYSRNLIEARNRANDYVKEEYTYEYYNCRNKCSSEFDKIRAQGNRHTYMRSQDKLNQEALETYNSCMENKCNAILNVQAKECYDYIDKYIEKKKSRK